MELKAVVADHVPGRMRRRMTLMGSMVVGGAAAALDDAGLGERDDQASIGSVFGTSYGEIAVACRIFEQGLDAGISPTAFHNSVHNAPLGYLSIFSGLRGPSLTLSDSTLSGEESMAEAASILSEGAARAVIVGAGDESCPSIFSPCWRTGEDAPRETARSLESGDTLVTDEGCGFLVLEGEQDARERGARIHARLEAVARAGTLSEALEAMGSVSLAFVPAGLDRKADPDALAVARDVLGPEVEISSEGETCGYVPASGMIRCVLAVGRIAGGARSAAVVGQDLDGHAAAVRLGAPGGGS
jgi:hypothetical protein